MIASARQADGRQQVFQSTAFGNVLTRWQLTPNGGWSGWVELGKDLVATKGLSASANADGRLEVFAVANDGSVSHCWQTAPNSGWSGWVKL